MCSISRLSGYLLAYRTEIRRSLLANKSTVTVGDVVVLEQRTGNASTCSSLLLICRNGVGVQAFHPCKSIQTVLSCCSILGRVLRRLRLTTEQCRSCGQRLICGRLVNLTGLLGPSGSIHINVVSLVSLILYQASCILGVVGIREQAGR